MAAGPLGKFRMVRISRTKMTQIRSRRDVDRHALNALATGCLILSAVLCLAQFKSDSIMRLTLGFVAVLPVWWLSPSWRVGMLSIPILLSGVFLADAFMFRHRLAVEARNLPTFLDISVMEDIITSPSGRTTAYIVGNHWLDSSYCVYLSAGGLFPRTVVVQPISSGAAYPKDIKAVWSGPLFTIGEGQILAAYDERNGKLYTYWELGRGDLESFGRYIETIR